MNMKSTIRIAIAVILAIILIGGLGAYYISQQEEEPEQQPPDVEAPVADAGGPYSATIGDEITLDGSGSTDDDTIISYDWDIDGDGTFDTTGINPTIDTSIYWSYAGTYTISLTVEDNDAKTDTATADITLSEVDLCGNGVIDPGENCENCPADVGPCQEDVTEGTGIRRPLVPVFNGDTFWLDIYVNPSGYNIGAFKVSLDYDSSKLQYITQEPGNLWADWWIAGEQTTGSIDNAQSSTFSGSGMSSKGTLFRVQFKAIATGTAPISFTYGEFVNYENNQITVTMTDNTIEVN